MQPINNTQRTDDGRRDDDTQRTDDHRRATNPRTNRTAISGQRALHPRQLGESAASTSTRAGPSSNVQRRVRLTDDEMAAAQAGWNSGDHTARGETHTARNLNNPAGFTRIEQQQNRFNRPVGFDIRQEDGTMAQLIQDGRAGLLLNAREGRNLRTSMEQKQISRPYFWASGLTPITAVAFGLGAFDGRIAARTGGRIMEMDRTDKWQALVLLAPISLMGWVIVGVLLFLTVVAAKGGL